MSTKNYERPLAIITNVHTLACLCLSGTENVSNETYGHDENNDIVWNF